MEAVPYRSIDDPHHLEVRKPIVNSSDIEVVNSAHNGRSLI